jgi:hypothetical protein
LRHGNDVSLCLADLFIVALQELYLLGSQRVTLAKAVQLSFEELGFGVTGGGESLQEGLMCGVLFGEFYFHYTHFSFYTLLIEL